MCGESEKKEKSKEEDEEKETDTREIAEQEMKQAGEKDEKKDEGREKSESDESDEKAKGDGSMGGCRLLTISSQSAEHKCVSQMLTRLCLTIISSWHTLTKEFVELIFKSAGTLSYFWLIHLKDKLLVIIAVDRTMVR